MNQSTPSESDRMNCFGSSMLTRPTTVVFLKLAAEYVSSCPSLTTNNQNTVKPVQNECNRNVGHCHWRITFHLAIDQWQSTSTFLDRFWSINRWIPSPSCHHSVQCFSKLPLFSSTSSILMLTRFIRVQSYPDTHSNT